MPARPAAFLLIVAAFSAPAQEFEVASVKLCRAGDPPPSGGAPTPGRLSLGCVTAANLIRMAYLVFPTGQPNAPVSPNALFQPLSGGPAWMDSERYRIDATAAGPANLEMLRGPMMQALLADRFQLQLHRETRPVDVFELTAGKAGPKLAPSHPGGCVVIDRNHPPFDASGPPACGALRPNLAGGFDVSGITLPELCRALTAFVDRDIVDQTGIAGEFDLHLDLTPGDVGSPGAAADATSTFSPGDGRALAAALAKLGLELRPAKGSAQYLVIDRIAKPSEN